MTDTNEGLALASLERLVDDDGARRDQWGRYMIEGKPHTRVSTILEELDNKATLVSWQSAMTVNGLLGGADAELVDKVRTLWAEHGGDPWYASPAGKKAAKVLLEALAVAGGSKRSAGHGTNVHALSAAHDTGAAYDFPTPHHQAWLEGYVAALEGAGIKIDPEYVERIIVLDRFGAAGTFDRGRCLVPGFDEALLGDLKTGSSLEWGRHKIASQLGAYTHADAVIELGAAVDGSEDRRLPMPAISSRYALVIHAPFNQPGEVTFHVVDAAAGWVGFELAAAAREWHAGPGDQWQPLPLELEGALEASLAALTPPSPVPLWLQERIDVIGRTPAARERLERSWPAGVPPLRRSTDHTIEQLTAIELVLDRVEAECSIPFGAPCPGRLDTGGETRWIERLRAAFPGSQQAHAHAHAHAQGDKQ